MELSSTIWLTCYFIVLLGLSGYGLHRYTMVYLFLKYSRNKPEPLREFDELPMVTVQLPIFNELHVVERLIDVRRLTKRACRLQQHDCSGQVAVGLFVPLQTVTHDVERRAVAGSSLEPSLLFSVTQ